MARLRGVSARPIYLRDRTQKAEDVDKGILFTDDHSPAAAETPWAIGFHPNGDYRIVLLRPA